MAKIDVIYSVWGVGDEAAGDSQVFSGGVQEVRLVASSAEFQSAGGANAEPRVVEARYVAAGVAAGVVRLVESTDAENGQLDGHVESQQDSEAAYDAAVEAGTWQEGNLQQFVSQTEERLALSDEEANLTPGDRRWLTQGLAAAHESLGNTDSATAIRNQLDADYQEAAANGSLVDAGPQDVQGGIDVLTKGPNSPGSATSQSAPAATPPYNQDGEV